MKRIIRYPETYARRTRRNNEINWRMTHVVTFNHTSFTTVAHACLLHILRMSDFAPMNHMVMLVIRNELMCAQINKTEKYWTWNKCKNIGLCWTAEPITNYNSLNFKLDTSRCLYHDTLRYIFQSPTIIFHDLIWIDLDGRSFHNQSGSCNIFL